MPDTLGRRASLGLAVLGVLLLGPHTVRAQIPTVEYRGGQWFDGRQFTRRSFYVIDGTLRSSRPPRVDSVIDLHDAFVVPPYADAHVHDLGDSASLADDIRSYQSQGVFYVMEMDPGQVLSPSVRARVNQPATVDAQYVQGIMVASWGGIAAMYQTRAASGAYGDRRSIAALDGREVFLIDTPADLDRKWPLLVAEHPDLVKVHMDYSEEFGVRRANPAYPDGPGFSAKEGIDPALVPLIARRAHAAGLRLAAHIETAADFRTALASGVDIIAHLPASWEIGRKTGFRDTSLTHWELTDADAALAAARHAIVVTTLGKDSADPDRAAYETVYRHNLAILARHHVRLVLGSDSRPGSAPGEALYIASLGSLDTRTVLRMLTETTAQAIFPGRRIGLLRDGYEASFVALGANPLEDLRAIRDIRFAVKQGVTIPATHRGGPT